MVALIATTGAQTPGSDVGGETTTPAIDTTGANALFFYTNSQGGAVFVYDSAGNAWVANPPTMYSTISRFIGSNGILWYAVPPIVTSTHHTFWSGGPGMSIQVAAFSGVATTSPYDTESAGANVTTGTTVSTGPVTPNFNGSLILAVTGEGWAAPLSVEGGFTVLGPPLSAVPGVAYAAGWAWLVQSAAATVNPAFHFGSLIAGARGAMARAAVFKALPTGGGGGGGTPQLAMDDVNCTLYPLTTSHLISLRWSDDRGHSYGSPVTQSIGEAGEYRTSLQWQRLSYSRDRVFELSWSVPMRTALQGCWVDVTPAQS
jgi:hypothetical protein